MEHPHPHSTMTPHRPFRIHPAVWLIAAGLIAALAAIFVFNVAVGTVITYGLVGLMLICHLFMHGVHGSHGGRGQHGGAEARRGGPASDSESANKQAGRSGGCH